MKYRITENANQATKIVHTPHIAIMIFSRVGGLGASRKETTAVRRLDCHFGCSSTSKTDAMCSSPKRVGKKNGHEDGGAECRQLTAPGRGTVFFFVPSRPLLILPIVFFMARRH